MADRFEPFQHVLYRRANVADDLGKSCPLLLRYGHRVRGGLQDALIDFQSLVILHAQWIAHLVERRLRRRTSLSVGLEAAASTERSVHLLDLCRRLPSVEQRLNVLLQLLSLSRVVAGFELGLTTALRLNRFCQSGVLVI